MSEKETIKSIVDKLGDQKHVFLQDVESSINKHISKKSWSECLTINQLYSNGAVKYSWAPEVSKKYFKRLSAFLRGKRFNGDNLDSKLTDGVVKLVTEKFNSFYASNSDQLTKPLTEQIMKDQVFVQQLASQIIDCSCFIHFKFSNYRCSSSNGTFFKDCDCQSSCNHSFQNSNGRYD